MSCKISHHRANLTRTFKTEYRPPTSDTTEQEIFERVSLLFLCPDAGRKEGSCTFPALAAASYPFVDLPTGNTLRCKLFPSSKFTVHLFP